MRSHISNLKTHLKALENQEEKRPKKSTEEKKDQTQTKTSKRETNKTQGSMKQRDSSLRKLTRSTNPYVVEY